MRGKPKETPHEWKDSVKRPPTLATIEGTDLNLAAGRQGPGADGYGKALGQASVGFQADPTIELAVAQKLCRAAESRTDLHDLPR